MPASHYQTLGIDPSASKEQVSDQKPAPCSEVVMFWPQLTAAGQVKQAYRQKALRYHPDLSDEEDARQRFVAVTEAYGMHLRCASCSTCSRQAELTTTRRRGPARRHQQGSL